MNFWKSVDRHPLLEQIPQSVQAAPTPRPVEPGIRQQQVCNINDLLESEPSKYTQTINRHQQLDQNPTRLLLTQVNNWSSVDSIELLCFR